MDITRTAFGTWNGGRFMNYGEPITDDRFIALVHRAFERGVRTFLTADVYGTGAADELIGRALAGLPRDEYCLGAMIGHDFYTGRREGSKGFPRFTNSALRGPADYASYLRMATEESLARCAVDRFDLVMLHNPDRIGYTEPAVWDAMAALRDAGLTRTLGIAPGPANGFPLDLILAFERFADRIDHAMIILNPFEPWPGEMVLGAARAHDIGLIARVVDYGGVFHDDVKPGHSFGHHDHRAFRPAGWVEAAAGKVEAIRPIADRHQLTLLQLACLWTLAQPAMRCVVPTLIQEAGDSARPIEDKLDDLAALPAAELPPEEIAFMRRIGDNTGCMKLKGASPAHHGDDLADNWALDDEVADVARRWRIAPEKDLAFVM